MNTRTIRNWDKSQSWQPEAIYRPAGEADVAQIIRQAAAQGKKVKPIGNALSWSDIIDIPTIAIQFDKMAQVLRVDRDRRQITVQAGVPLQHVNEALAAQGLALDNFGSIVDQTAAGYVATASHGTGARTPILSTYITRMRLVDGRGEAHELDAKTEPELFSAARVNLGCLGVVTEITFDCVEAFDLEERLELVEFDQALADLDTIIDGNDYCKIWWLPYTDKLQFYLFNKTDKPRVGAGFSGFLDESGISGILFNILLALGRTVPSSIPFINQSLQNIHYRPHRRVDRSDRVIKVGSAIPNHQETEYGIPLDQAAEAINAVRTMILKADYRVNFPLEVRFVAGDDIPMSPMVGRDSCFIGPYVSSEKWARPYFAEFEALIGDYAGRPHWGKSFSIGAKELRELYPAYDAFNALREECDPHGLFRNRFVDRVFPP